MLKFILLGFILLLLSVGYRFFGHKQDNLSKKGLFNIEPVHADAPENVGGVGCVGTDSGCGGGGSSGGSGGGDGGSDGCFKAGALVATKFISQGEFLYKKIEEINAGDEIMGVVFDAAGNPLLRPARVIKTHIHKMENRCFYELITQGGTRITATDNHPFIIDAKNTGLNVANIKKNQLVVTVSSSPQWDEVQEIKNLLLDYAAVFNITTATSNYLVSHNGANWILAHNK